jgi:hypothetical protein
MSDRKIDGLLSMIPQLDRFGFDWRRRCGMVRPVTTEPGPAPRG